MVLWLNGCCEDGKPFLQADGSGLYTTQLIEELGVSDSILDFVTADRNACFMCKVAQTAAGQPVAAGERVYE